MLSLQGAECYILPIMYESSGSATNHYLVLSVFLISAILGACNDNSGVLNFHFLDE